MEMNEQLLEVLKQTLQTLNEMNQKLDGIEKNTYDIDTQQQSLKKSMFTLQRLVENDNFIG
ncbi:hypothetical protein IV487_10845 [Enterococcus saccharolyticus]|uniref:Phage protein n=1 Tax=Candidatus Enterococcus willemsii TaxID=1857215 RepID=A0ABQ6Z1K9_9ENTE|nr:MULTISPECIES: hypothetical protein [Enterococcus]KAF1305349.1 hypothetical protein BAU17_13280 [Enterococcus sp. CU12B]MCD5002959.1 hypothetical protein [Enterococcus saccharolyticus]